MSDVNEELPVLKIQRFCTHDGPGIRTTVFLQGCMLRCAWCHNPESQKILPAVFYEPSLCIGCRLCESVCKGGAHKFSEGRHILDRSLCSSCAKCCKICPSGALEVQGKPMRIGGILQEAEKDRAFYGKEGGLTLSGGEPMLHGEKALALLRCARERGLNVAVETCGYFDEKFSRPLAESADLLLWDLKDTNEQRHLSYTGRSPRRILQNLYEADRAGGKIILRCILLKGLNTEEKHFGQIAQVYRSLKNCLYVSVFSYKHYGEGKYAALGLDYRGNKSWVLSRAELKTACESLAARGVRCRAE